MKIAFFDSHHFEQDFFREQNKKLDHEITFFEPRLTEQSASLAQGFPCVCAFVNDRLNRATLEVLKKNGCQLIALRSAGFNHVDLAAAHQLGLKIVRVPEYSPHAVAEHAMALILSLNRKIHRSYNRVREANFSLNGLVGFDLHKKTAGIIGTGKIGTVMCRILAGFGCKILAHDLTENSELASLGVKYVDRDELLQKSDLISLHVPLTPETHHLIDSKAISIMKPGVMLINTSRGGLIDTHSLIQFLKSKHIGYAGLDVYEEEEGVFFENLSEGVLQDDQLARLLTFPNIILTSHQAFLTREALSNIAETTLSNITAFEGGKSLVNEVYVHKHVHKV